MVFWNSRLGEGRGCITFADSDYWVLWTKQGALWSLMANFTFWEGPSCHDIVALGLCLLTRISLITTRSGNKLALLAIMPWSTVRLDTEKEADIHIINQYIVSNSQYINQPILNCFFYYTVLDRWQLQSKIWWPCLLVMIICFPTKQLTVCSIHPLMTLFFHEMLLFT